MALMIKIQDLGEKLGRGFEGPVSKCGVKKPNFT